MHVPNSAQPKPLVKRTSCLFSSFNLLTFSPGGQKQRIAIARALLKVRLHLLIKKLHSVCELSFITSVVEVLIDLVDFSYFLFLDSKLAGRLQAAVSWHTMKDPCDSSK